MPANIELVPEGFNKITNMHFFDEKLQYTIAQNFQRGTCA